MTDHELQTIRAEAFRAGEASVMLRLTGFGRLVQEMRELQKKYFAGNHSPRLLAQAKQLERRVDLAVDDVLEPKEQGSLFDEVI
jgi:hypothetical protein